MDLNKIGNLIKSKRKELNLTQEELASKLNITEKAISKWETGRGAPDISLLIPLSKELNCSVLELLNGEKIEDENKTIVNILKQEKKKIDIFKTLFLITVNIILIISLFVLIFGYIIPKKYEGRISTMYSLSMSPTIYPKESIIFDRVDISKVKENDIIVYYYEGFETIHRVIKILKDEKNNVILTTKGDNNIVNDNYSVTKDNFIGIYSKKVPKLSNIFTKNGIEISSTVFVILTILNFVIVALNITYIKKK